MGDIEQLKEDLTLYRNALRDIIAGKITYFSKGDTRYSLINIKDLRALIQDTATQIAIIDKRAIDGCSIECN